MNRSGGPSPAGPSSLADRMIPGDRVGVAGPQLSSTVRPLFSSPRSLRGVDMERAPTFLSELAPSDSVLLILLSPRIDEGFGVLPNPPAPAAASVGRRFHRSLTAGPEESRQAVEGDVGSRRASSRAPSREGDGPCARSSMEKGGARGLVRLMLRPDRGLRPHPPAPVVAAACLGTACKLDCLR